MTAFPTLRSFVSYQTESDCYDADELSEERWNYAFWQQNETPVIEADDGDKGMKILFDWYRENGIEHIGRCDTLLLSCGLIPENEISRSMGVELNPVTSGPSVNESLETNIPGVFACGNVLHVHDLVDYVSEEAGVAGKNAAKYIKCGGDHADSGKEIPIVATDGVRYTVPKTLHVANMDDELTVRFRVGGVYKNCYISTYLNDQRIICRKRPVMAPGEMEQVKLQKSVLEAMSDLDHITIKIEEEA